MRRDVWTAIALVMILPVMLFTASCTKKLVQTLPVLKTEPEVQKAPDRSAEEAKQAGRLEEDRLWAEAAAVREAAETAFVDENIHFAFDSSVLSTQAQNISSNKSKRS